MTSREVLVAARARIADARHWCQLAMARDEFHSSVHARSRAAVRWCALGAVDSVTEASEADLMRAHNRLRKASFYLRDEPVSVYNDAPLRRHAEVLRLFDAAITRKYLR